MNLRDHPVLMRNLLYGALILSLVFLALLAARRIQVFHQETTNLTRQIYQAGTRTADKEIWERRSLWIRQNIPVFEDQNDAVAQLKKSLKDTVEAHGEWNLKFESIEHGTVAGRPGGNFERTFVDVTVSGSERDIVAWIHAMQNPAAFQGIERIAMELGYSNLLCEARICQWFVTPSRN